LYVVTATTAATSAQKVAEVNKKNKERLVHKGVKIAGITGAVISALALGGIAITGGPAVISASGAFAALVGVIVGVGALAGFIRSKTHPISAEDVQNQSPKALAAQNFKKNTDVQRGVKITGIVSGVMAGIVAVGGVIGLSGLAAAVGGGASGAGAALLGFAFSVAFVGGPVIGAMALLIGLGALGGYIHSRIKKARLKNTPEGPVTASPEAKALIDEVVAKGPTAKNQVKASAKTGAKVGGIISGIGVGLFAVGTSIAAATGAAASVGTVFWIAGIAFLPLGFGLLALTGICIGIGALVGYFKSKKAQD